MEERTLPRYPAGKRELIFGLLVLLFGTFTWNSILYGGFCLGFALGAVALTGCSFWYLLRCAIPLVHLRDDVVLQIRVSLGVLSLRFRKNGLSPFRICGVLKGICRDILSQVLVFRPLLFIFFLLQDIDEIHGAAAVSGRFFLSEKFFF